MKIHILSITDPSDLFASPEKVSDGYKQLVKTWHPDINPAPEAKDVFIKIQELHQKACEMIANGTWRSKNELRIKDISGTSFRINFKKSYEFELGKFYISDTIIAYEIENGYKDLVNNAMSVISRLKFANDLMKKEFSRYLPQIKKIIKTESSLIVIIHKTEDLYLLSDITKLKIDQWDRHVAWIISSLLNLNCYLEYAGLSHNAISLDTCLISPMYHSVALLGGWWYTSSLGNKLTALPSSTFSLLPFSVCRSKIASKAIDQELIRNIARELLEYKVGKKMTIPDSFFNWLLYPFGGNTYQDYEKWGNVLNESYGGRKFIPMNIDGKMIHGSD